MKYLLLTVFLLGWSLGTAGATETNISGTWAFSVSLDGGPQNFPMTFVLKQASEKLSGTQGENKLSGTVKGNKITITIEGKNKAGYAFKNTFTGTIESSTKMVGTCEFPKGPGKWIATKQ
ncbi:MAG: hypothetical protein JST85_04170 [Acidobacteria bacterium]|nr:hypothetical protein [Acidobacteriota bacterium]